MGRRELGRDAALARELFRVAAALGHAAASFNAGHLFAGVDERASLFYLGARSRCRARAAAAERGGGRDARFGPLSKSPTSIA